MSENERIWDDVHRLIAPEKNFLVLKASKTDWISKISADKKRLVIVYTGRTCAMEFRTSIARLCDEFPVYHTEQERGNGN